MGKVAFIFSGQGAQYVGMGKEIVENFDVAKETFELANEALPFDLNKLILEGPQDELNKTEITQPAILTTSIAILKVLEEKGIKPDVVAGLSLGEYSALVCSKVLGFREAVALVNKRGKYMQEAVPQGKGTMAAIMGLDSEAIEEVCKEASKDGIVEPANFNCPGQVVIGGEIKAIKSACEIALSKGAKRAKELSVSAPFHTSMLEPAKIKLSEELKNIELNDIEIPIITNVTADYVSNKDEIKDLLARQVVSSVLWEDSIKKMISDGVDTFIEIGPGKVLSSFVKKVDRKLNILNVEDISSLEKALKALGGEIC